VVLGPRLGIHREALEQIERARRGEWIGRPRLGGVEGDGLPRE